MTQCEKTVVRQRSFWHVIALAIFMLLSFSTLKYLPGMLILQDIWTAIIFAGVLYVYLPYVLKHGCLNIWFEGYVLMMMLLAPLISAVGALNEFGQPLFYGLAAGRSTLLMGAGLLYTVMFRARIVDLELTRRAVIFTACISVVGWSFATAVIDTTQFDEPIPGLLEIGEGGKLLLDPGFIVFGFFYFVFSYFFAGNKRSGFVALFFLAYLILGLGGRMCILATFLTLAIFLWRKFSFDKVFFVGFKVVFVMALLSITLFATLPEKMEELVVKFQDAISVVVSGEEVEDVSAYARLMQKGIAEPYVERNLLFGSGFLSNQWEGGFLGRFNYFHPSDIGVFGVLFQYGVVGTVLFLFFYLFYLFFLKKIPDLKDSSGMFAYSSSAMILYWFFYSASTGWFAFSVEQLVMVLSILLCLVEYRWIDHDSSCA